jgi:hypothetical protein
MKRTTIMLPDDLRRRARARARRRSISLGKLIRDSLDASLLLASCDSERDPLFEDVVFDGPTPRDLSRRHDKYLADDESSSARR